jgi:DMSO/TMAO reductase YedYZ molybdopterin-dependent catalytic subunit
MSEIPPEIQQSAQAEVSRRTRRSLLTGAATVAIVGAAYRLWDRLPKIGTMHRPQRDAEEFNRAISQHLLGETTLSPTYPPTRSVRKPFPNGFLGIRKDLDPASWRLQLTGLHQPQNHPRYVQQVTDWQYRYHPTFAQLAHQIDLQADLVQAETNSSMTEENPKVSTPTGVANEVIPTPTSPSGPGLLLTLADIKSLPFVEQTTEFKCVEGWSEIVTHGGVRFRDFIEAYPPLRNPDGSLPKYVFLSTPDGAFYSGHEIAAMLHPQTLLCFQMGQRDLTPAHGAPLRLTMPIKYGYKQIKQIASITYTNTRPPDYWANRAYDWHGGL